MVASRRGRSAFTLIELLVVISIIALLLAILVPSLSGARRQARQAKCLANLSQLGKAVLIYSDQYSGYVPQTFGGPVPWNADRGALFQITIASGVINKDKRPPDILVCPDAKPRGAVSYALNAVVFGYKDQDIDPTQAALVDVPPVKLSGVRTPSKVITLYDVSPTSLARVWGGVPVNNDEADISDQFTAKGMATASHGPIIQNNEAGFMWMKSLADPPVEAIPPHGTSHSVLFIDTHAGRFERWDPIHMTRLTGKEPNDTKLH
ncbi:MAG: type II secretion system protein [Phycisphaerae bacterium]